MLHATLVCLVLFLASHGQTMDEEPVIVRRHEVRWLTALIAEDKVPPYIESPIPRYGGSEIRNPFEREWTGSRRDQASELITWLETLDVEVTEDEEHIGRSGLLSAYATAGDHARAAMLLDELRARWTQPLEVQWLLLPAHAVVDRANAVLTPDEVSSLLAQVQVIERHGELSVADRPSILRRNGWEALLINYRNEGPFETLELDPTVAALKDGIELCVIPSRDEQGGWDLRVMHLETERLPLRLTRYPKDGELLHLPQRHWKRWFTSAAVPDGGGLLLAANGGRGAAWLLTVRNTGSAPPRSGEGSVRFAFPVREPWYWHTWQRFGPVPTGGWWGSRSLYAEPLVEYEELNLSSTQTSWAQDWLERDPSPEWVIIGSALHARGQASSEAELEEHMRAFAPGFMPTYQVDFRTLRGESRSLWRDLGESPTPHAIGWKSAVRAGDALVNDDLLVSSYVRDVGLTLGNSSSGLAPSVTELMRGRNSSVRCVPALSGGIDVTVRCAFSSIERASIQMVVPIYGTNGVPERLDDAAEGPPAREFNLELPQLSTSLVVAEFRAESGQWTLAGLADVADSPDSIAVWVRVTELAVD